LKDGVSSHEFSPLAFYKTTLQQREKERFLKKEIKRERLAIPFLRSASIEHGFSLGWIKDGKYPRAPVVFHYYNIEVFF